MNRCRSCGGTTLDSILDFGLSPVADRLLRPDQLHEAPRRFPLLLAMCADCSLVQLTESLDPGFLFGDEYPYLSSVVELVVANAGENVREVLEGDWLEDDGWVLEVASNDGYLLQHFEETSVQILGVDPALPAVTAARQRGIPTLHDFFSSELAERILAERGPAHAIFANNILAHVRDLNGFTRGLKTLLHPRGCLRVEVPYAHCMVTELEFDTIYHQHLCYFSVATLQKLFARHGLRIQKVQQLGIHGGSLRLTVTHGTEDGESLKELLAFEVRRGVNKLETYHAFSKRAATLVKELKSYLTDLKGEGYKIAAYGAAAKGTTLLHFADIDRSLLEYVVDRNVFKHGRYLDGPALEILPPHHLIDARIEFALLLAWNHADEIIAQNQDYLETGGRFIVPIPELGLR